MDVKSFDSWHSHVTKVDPWTSKIVIDNVDIGPLLTSYASNEKHLQKNYGYPRNTRHRFKEEKYKGVGARAALVSELKKICHFYAGFNLSVKRTDSKGLKDKLVIVRMYCFHSRLSQSSNKDFEEGKMSQSGTKTQTFKQNKVKKNRPEKYKTHTTAPLTEDKKCNFIMNIFCSSKDEFWYLESFKTASPSFHCNHRKEDPSVLPTPIGLLDEQMKNDLRAASKIHLNPTDASNFMNQKYKANFSPHQMRQFKYNEQACSELNKNASSASRLISVMEKR